MYFQHIYEEGLAQASYFIGCQKTKEAIVIDPRRDIDVYLEIAENKNFNITHITETHIHADFLSGSRELAAATDAKIYLSDEGGNDWQYQFDHIGLKHEDVIKVGNIIIKVLHTPGHTPEHISFLLTDTVSSNEPVMIFTGDFVFVGDIGRPDLLEKAAGLSGTQEIGAKQMYESIQKFKNIPDHVQVWPGHGAGSACGKSLGAVPSTTVGYEKLVNWALQINSEKEFVNTLLAGQPEPPKYFAMMKKLNKFGPNILGGTPRPAKLTLHQFREALEKNITIVDSRDKLSFAGGHVRGSINIQDNLEFATWAGWMLEYDHPFILIGNEERINEITKALVRIGMENFYGYVSDLNKWANQCHELEIVQQISVAELKSKLNIEPDTYEIIDVRGYSDYNINHVENSKNIHVGYLTDNLDKISKQKTTVVYCESGNRSSIAASTLLKNGISNVINLTGGFSAWVKENEILEIA